MSDLTPDDPGYAQPFYYAFSESSSTEWVLMSRPIYYISILINLMHLSSQRAVPKPGAMTWELHCDQSGVLILTAAPIQLPRTFKANDSIIYS